MVALMHLPFPGKSAWYLVNTAHTALGWVAQVRSELQPPEGLLALMAACSTAARFEVCALPLT